MAKDDMARHRAVRVWLAEHTKTQGWLAKRIKTTDAQLSRVLTGSARITPGADKRIRDGIERVTGVSMRDDVAEVQ